MMALLAASLRRGHSGVRVEVVELLLAMLERDVVPLIPSRGSVGSSGDLAPLAHLALVLIGEGEVLDGRPGGEALAAAGLAPVTLAAKEGLALINGTHLMAAAGTLAVLAARRVLEAAIVAVALSLEAFKGSTVPFDARLHEVRGQPGPARVAARLRELLAGSPVVASHADCGRVQDPYTLRCAPQVLGAVDDALAYVEAALERELRAVTDNPLVFADDDAILSGGNFHGQPLSLPLDHLALAVTELASFSERRTYALLTPGYAGLPAFLTPQPGLSSGLMIAQYAAAALVNECQTLSHPAGAGSIPTSAGMEDFNSMGAWAALKARTVVGHRGPGRRDRAGLRVPGPGVPPPAAEHRCARGPPRARAVDRAAGRGGPLAGSRARRAGRARADRVDLTLKSRVCLAPGSGRRRRCRRGGRCAAVVRAAHGAPRRAIARIRLSAVVRARSARARGRSRGRRGRGGRSAGPRG